MKRRTEKFIQDQTERLQEINAEKLEFLKRLVEKIEEKIAMLEKNLNEEKNYERKNKIKGDIIRGQKLLKAALKESESLKLKLYPEGEQQEAA